METGVIYTTIVLIVSNILWYIGYKNEESIVANFLIMAAQFLPMIVCLIMTKISREGWNNLGIKICKKSWKYFAIAIAGTIGITYLSYPLMLFLFRESVSLDFGKDQMVKILLMTLIGTACCVECLGEELGWIGYLYGKLESMLGTIWACVILGIIRGVYHIGILIHMDYTIPAFLELTFSNICLSFFYGLSL